ncbi:hypothetical protein EMCG_07940 [[Emmonsia] crescens]|uniref:Uncharacterized protein n=1 Tax=[Emmonsia] crescens TaxID=73230 RepID=A0A0G2J515_9EURO|nr:hypothetical protein EMCG_07940 [Emmonsia crescens UAMH 3008]
MPMITSDATQRLPARTRHYVFLRADISGISQESLMFKIGTFLDYALFAQVFLLRALRTLSDESGIPYDPSVAQQLDISQNPSDQSTRRQRWSVDRTPVAK